MKVGYQPIKIKTFVPRDYQTWQVAFSTLKLASRRAHFANSRHRHLVQLLIEDDLRAAQHQTLATCFSRFASHIDLCSTFAGTKNVQQLAGNHQWRFARFAR